MWCNGQAIGEGTVGAATGGAIILVAAPGFAMETRRPMQNKHARPPNKALISCSSLVTPPDQGNGEELGFFQFLYWGFSFSF